MATSQTQASNFEFKATADFNGDGKPDIFWRNQATGQNEIWFMDGATVLSKGPTVSQGADPNWSIVGSGDFDGDGKTDILWRNSVVTNTNTNDNYVVIWLMDGLGLTGLVTQNQNADLKQSVDFVAQDVGDYNGDGKADILWRNSTGVGEIWTMNGATATSIGTLSQPVPNDFNIVNL